MARQPTLLFFVSEDWYFVSHRLPLALAAKEAGFKVKVTTRVNHHGEIIRDAGLELIPIEDFVRSGHRPVQELRLLAALIGLYRREAPDLVHNVALKPVIYGTLAARIARVKGIVNALAGLGWVFTSESFRARSLRPPIRLALSFALGATNTRTIVQNADDAAFLVDQRLSPPAGVRLIRGSGVDPNKHFVSPPPVGVPLVVLPARLLATKGVFEFLRAAQQLRAEGVRARFVLVGDPDPVNPATLTPDDIDPYVRRGDVEHWGWREDMPSVFNEASVVCLPSYREGLPKALLEAAASARAIVATDVPGCREIVRPGQNGWLVPPKDAFALAAALREAITHPDLCERYGASGRSIVEHEFTHKVVIKEMLDVYTELLTIGGARR